MNFIRSFIWSVEYVLLYYETKNNNKKTDIRIEIKTAIEITTQKIQFKQYKYIL